MTRKKRRQREHVCVEYSTPEGVHFRARVDPDISPESLDALQRIVKAAYEQVTKATEPNSATTNERKDGR